MGPNFHLQHQHVFHLIPSPPRLLRPIGSSHHWLIRFTHGPQLSSATSTCLSDSSSSPAPRLLRPVGSSSFLPHQVHSWAPTFICSINMSFIFTPRPRSLKIFREGRGTHQVVRIRKMLVSRPELWLVWQMLRVERLRPAGDLPQRAGRVHPLYRPVVLSSKTSFCRTLP